MEPGSEKAEYWIKQFRGKSVSELQVELNRWEDGPLADAAKFLLDEAAKANEEREVAIHQAKTAQATAQSDLQHRERQWVSKFAVLVSIASAVAGWASFFASQSRLARSDQRLSAAEHRLDTIEQRIATQPPKTVQHTPDKSPDSATPSPEAAKAPEPKTPE